MPLALLITILFVYSYVKAVQSGQFEDLDTPAYRILLDDQKIVRSEEKNDSKS